MSIVVSDTSPIRALNHLGLLDLLGRLFDRVYIPPAVVRELTRPRPRFEAVNVLGEYAFVEVRAPHDLQRVQQFDELLDAGESEALVLALEVGAEALLIDDSAGRAVALEEGVSVIGTLGILSRMKLRGHVSAIRPLLERLQVELDFYLSAQLKDEFLNSVGE